MGAQVARLPRLRVADRSARMLRLIWLELLAAQLLMFGVYGGTVYAAVVYGPGLFSVGSDIQDIRVPAELPKGWPQDEVRLPAKACRSRLPEEYFTYGLDPYKIAGQRWEDPLNWGSYPELWMVSFTDHGIPGEVFREMTTPLQEPLYKLTSVTYDRESTQFVYTYCDGDTLVYINGPGPYSRRPYYTIRVLVYDN